MNVNKAKYLDLMLERCKKGLEKNRMKVTICENIEEVKTLLFNMIEEGSVVSDGGSMTLLDEGIIDHLKQKKITYDSHNHSRSLEEKQIVMRRAFSADYFLTSSNAITMNGELINVDGNGNRVAAMIFGPKHVIVVAGYNKIVEDEQAAITRIKTIAAPVNCIRLNMNTPCSHTGVCGNCFSDDRICCSYVKIDYDRARRIHVILVKEDLGY